MELLKRILVSFKSQPDIWFFYGFLATCTFSIRKVLFFYPINGQFNEYTGIYLYLSDIFLIGALFSWVFIILYNNKSYLSNKAIFTTRLFHVEQFHKFAQKDFWLIITPLLLIIWAFLSLIWSENKFLALFRSFKLVEFYLLYIYLIYRIVPRSPRQLFHVEQFDRGGTIFKNAFRLIIAVGFFQSILGITQFGLKHSVGLVWLRESLISPDTPGVAKLIFDGHKVIRAYGTFPHPNILGGFLMISILMTYFYHKLFHVEQFTAKIDTNCSTWNITSRLRNNFLKICLCKATNKFLQVFIIVQFLALALTFSKSAILGFAIAVGYIMYQMNVPRGTLSMIHIKKLFHVEHLTRKMVLIMGIILALGLIFRPDTNSLLFKSLNERLFYLNVSRGTILDQPLIGVGNGQSVIEIEHFVPRGTIIENWQYQPVHNIFLLIWSELGIIGLGLFVWLLWKLFHVEQYAAIVNAKCSTWNNTRCETYKPMEHSNVPRGTIISDRQTLIFLKGLLLSLLFIGLFDHYFWDIQQGEIMLWLTLGFLAGYAIRADID